ncbi:MAG: helix-turn-helix transcriptional regulator [Lachnospiraceae bacterium]|nr:helix-turn-helix transcriptional regulator [Lachnospiraceae bacterium]
MDNNSNFNVGEKIHTLRIQKGISQEELALQAEITPAYLGLIERNKKNPTVKILAKICDALNIKLSDFFSTDIEVIAAKTETDLLTEQIVYHISRCNETEMKTMLTIIKNVMKFKGS